MDRNMESQIHHFEKEAYCAALRAFMAQADTLTWDKQDLITGLRKELRVSDDEYLEIYSRVSADDTIKRIREWRRSIRDQAAMRNGSHPMSNARRRTGSEADLPPDSAGTGTTVNHSLAVNIHSTTASSNPLLRRRMMIRRPNDNNFYEAVISDYDPIQRLHALVYDQGTPYESLKWVALEEIPRADIRWVGENPSDFPTGGTVNKLPEVIEIFNTETLIKEVERVFNSSNPDPAEVERAKKKLKEQEQALVDAISILSAVTDSDEEPFPYGKL